MANSTNGDMKINFLISYKFCAAKVKISRGICLLNGVFNL